MDPADSSSTSTRRCGCRRPRAQRSACTRGAAQVGASDDEAEACYDSLKPKHVVTRCAVLQQLQSVMLFKAQGLNVLASFEQKYGFKPRVGASLVEGGGCGVFMQVPSLLIQITTQNL